MALAVCDHVPSANPRQANTCAKCGRSFNSEPAQVRRDRALENEITRTLLAGSLNIQVIDSLNAFAGRRADLAEREYGRDFPDVLERDMAKEGCDEQGDSRNYAVWWLDAYNRGLVPDSEHWKAEYFQRALKYSGLAFHEYAQVIR